MGASKMVLGIIRVDFLIRPDLSKLELRKWVENVVFFGRGVSMDGSGGRTADGDKGSGLGGVREEDARLFDHQQGQVGPKERAKEVQACGQHAAIELLTVGFARQVRGSEDGAVVVAEGLVDVQAGLEGRLFSHRNELRVAEIHGVSVEKQLVSLQRSAIWP
jgi:hypothetical protein